MPDFLLIVHAPLVATRTIKTRSGAGLTVLSYGELQRTEGDCYSSYLSEWEELDLIESRLICAFPRLTIPNPDGEGRIFWRALRSKNQEPCKYLAAGLIDLDDIPSVLAWHRWVDHGFWDDHPYLLPATLPY